MGPKLHPGGGLFTSTHHFRTEHFGKSHFGTDVSSQARTFRHSSTGAEMSVPKRPYCFARCRNDLGAKNSLCRKVPMSKRQSARASAGPKCARAEMFL